MMTSMQLFDMPEPLVSIGARTRTTIAPQALLLLNGHEIRNASEQFASTLLKFADHNVPAIITEAYRRILARAPRDVELQAHAGVMEQDIAEYQADGPEAARDALQQTTAGLVQTLLSLNEFIYVE